MEFNAANIRKIQQRIKKSLVRYGLEYHAEDCSQEFFLGLLEGKNKRSTINQFVIDYLRKFSGRKGSPGYAQRINLEFAHSFEPQKHDSSTGNFSGTKLDDRRAVEGLANRVKGRDQEVILKYLYGYTLLEIAAELQVTESRVSQIMSVATAKIQDDSFVDELLFSLGLANVKNLWRNNAK